MSQRTSKRELKRAERLLYPAPFNTPSWSFIRHFHTKAKAKHDRGDSQHPGKRQHLQTPKQNNKSGRKKIHQQSLKSKNGGRRLCNTSRDGLLRAFTEGTEADN